MSVVRLYVCQYKIAEKKMIEKYSEKVIVLSFQSFWLFQLVIYIYFSFLILSPNFY